MPTVYLLENIPYRAVDANLTPQPAALMHTWVAGAPGTPQTTYQDAAGTVPHPNPIVADVGGLFPQIWIAGSAYFLEARKPDDTTVLWQADGVQAQQVAAVQVLAGLAAPSGSAGIGYQPEGGGVARTVEEVLRERVSVTDRMSTTEKAAYYNRTNAVDHTAAIQAAINFAQGGKYLLHFPAGTAKISSALNITAGLLVHGDGRGCTQIAWSDKTMTALNIATNDQCIIRGIAFAAPSACTAGGAITLNAATGGQNAFSMITECTFSNGFVQFNTANSFAWICRDNYFSGAVSVAAIVSNALSPDAGDSSFQNNVISNLGVAAIGILQASSGGLRIVNNKILGGVTAIALNVAAGASTSILKVSENSCELQTTAGISLQFGAGSHFAIVDIDNNELSQLPIGISIPSATAVLTNLSINDNIISLSASGTFGIIVNGVSNFSVTTNTITGNGGTPVGIEVGSTSAQGRIVPGSMQGLTTKIQNSSGTTYVAPDWTQTGVRAVTCSTARGSLFYGSAAVTFPVAFDSAPTVTCDPGTVAGGISAWASSVTATGFTVNAISVTSGGAGSAGYSATGVV